MLAEPELRAELDRVAAAAGVRVVHAGDAAAVSRKTWAAAAAVVLDAAAAVRIGAARVLRLPEHEADLVGELAEAAESSRDDRQRGHAVAVIGGCGGAGASLLAVALAQAAGDALLVDLDPWGGGIELLLGGENTPGLRWPDLALQGGRLNWAAVRDALPRHRGVSVLSGTRRGHEVDAGPVHAVVDAGRRGAVSVICDLPRRFTDAAQAALGAADLVVVVSRCDVRACAATGALAPVLAAVNPNVGLVVRGPSPGGLRAAEIAGITGLPLLAAIKAQPQLGAQVERGGLRLGRRSALAVAARQVLGVLPPAGTRRKGKAA
ncbi:helicase [Mycobacterium avium subsp. hominissuis]|uniref:septum site-determining protein Ssd n=1 Tax=Mycobacterium avium TaxID=1764 RepID=UPI000BB2D259|nr:septum site-determining protein Ssd [Mycobacterium avium]PBJ62378.1 helicase [Mycobacterium avium subsp. hominissuis]